MSDSETTHSGHWVTDPKTGVDVKVHAGESASGALARARKEAAPKTAGGYGWIAGLVILAAIITAVVVVVVTIVSSANSDETKAKSACETQLSAAYGGDATSVSFTATHQVGDLFVFSGTVAGGNNLLDAPSFNFTCDATKTSTGDYNATVSMP